MRQSFHYHRATGGSFDVTVKPAVDLFKKTLGDRKTWPTELEIREVLNLIDARNIEFNGKAIFFKKDGMGVTFDGIAKGYIVDKAAEILSNQSIQNFLINAGGDIRTQGCKQGNQPWVVAIEDPQKKQKYPDIVHMRDGAIATSGNYEVYFDKEKVFHHLVNPKTGLSPGLSTSVSIMARTTMEADALATSVFVMEPAAGTDFINSLPNCESLVMARDGSLLKSKGWKTAAT